MAEIRIEPKRRSMAWVWLVVVLVLVAAAYVLWSGHIFTWR